MKETGKDLRRHPGRPQGKRAAPGARRSLPAGAARALAEPVCPPAPGRPARRSHCRMISSNACLCSRSRRLSSSEMWRFQRGKSAARRPDDMLRAARAPQHRRSEQGLEAAARSMRRPASAGWPAAPQLTSTNRPPPPPAGTVFRLPPEMALGRAGRPASPPDVLLRTHARGLRRRRALVNDALPRPEAVLAERRPLGGVEA